MINVGILGATAPKAGELIRILVHHPDVEIKTLYAPELAGRTVSSIHPGLIGETVVNFTDKLDTSDLDVIFITEKNDLSDLLFSNSSRQPELRLIDMTHTMDELETGLSEINRKGLVRGATQAKIPESLSVLPLIALGPLAQFLLLNDNIEVKITAPEKDIKAKDLNKIKVEVTQELKKIQNGYDDCLDINISSNDSERLLILQATVPCNLSLEELEKIYDDVYDDHNFTFTTLSPVAKNEVEGTQKCVLTLSKPSGSVLEITGIADSKMRGGAGDAVHVMNLLFGLYEKTGLNLKSSAYGVNDESSTGSSSWFA